jgi:hypothetical protein
MRFIEARLSAKALPEFEIAKADSSLTTPEPTPKS